MPLTSRSPLRLAGLIVAGVLLPASSLLAQTELPALRTSGASKTSDLQKPPTYDLPSPTSSVTNRSRAGRSTAPSTATDRGPDPTLFDGSNFPPEERPEHGLIAQFEIPGQDPEKIVQGPGEEEGGGPGEKGGGSDPDGGPGGIQVTMAGPQIPGLPIPMMGGTGAPGGLPGLPGMPSMPSVGAPPPLPTFEMPKDGKSGEGEPGKPGAEGADMKAPAPPPGAQGEPLEKPNAVKIGDEGAKLAEADTPRASASAQTQNAQGEDRMKIKAAAGNQPVNRDRGTERGVDIPSDL